MDEIRQKLYQFFADNGVTPENSVIAWSGGGFSSLLWYVAYKELNLRIPIKFVDDGRHPVGLYSFIESTRRKYDLDLEVISSENGVKEIVNKFPDKMILVGMPIEGGKTPEVDRAQYWNFLKSVGVPFYKSKKGFLG